MMTVLILYIKGIGKQRLQLFKGEIVLKGKKWI